MSKLREFWLFGLKQAYACLFGGFLLGLMLITSIWYPLEVIHRYDFIFIAAILFQVVLLLLRLETLREAVVIVVFHLVATVMELFKTSDAVVRGFTRKTLFSASVTCRYLPVLCTVQ